MKRVLVTAVGGNLGQAICQQLLQENVLIIGVDAISPLQGIPYCSKVYKVPFAIEETYISTLIDIVNKEKIDFVIPANDYELLKISGNDYLSPKSLCSENKTCVTFFDKYFCAEFFHNNNIPFCRTVLPSLYDSTFNSIIVKKRESSGSKGIFINPTDLSTFNDEYIIQEFEEGLELTIPFYVDKTNSVFDFIVLEKYGLAPNNTYCVNTLWRNDLLVILEKIVTIIPIKGPCNLQVIVNDRGIHPFEVNCRFSGSIDIQQGFGFNILKYSLADYLYLTKLQRSKQLLKGIGIRNYKSHIFFNKNIDDLLDLNA